MARSEGPLTSTVKPVRKTIEQTTTATGLIVPREKVKIKSQANGVLEEVLAKPGQWVKRGDLLGRIRLRAAVELERRGRLHDQHLISDAAFQDGQLKLDVTRTRPSLPCRWAGLVLLALLPLAQGSPWAAGPQPNNLLDVYRKAEEEDPQLLRGKASRQATEEVSNQAKARAMLPSVSLNANVSGNFQDIKLLQPNSVGNSGYAPFVTGGYSITLTQPLFHYDRYIAMDQAGQRVEQSEVELAALRQDLIMRVAERYFGMLGAMDSLRLAQDIPLAQPEPPDEDRWTDRAMAQNPRIIAATIAAEVSGNEIDRRSSEHLPNLDLVAGNGFFSAGGQFGTYQIHSNNAGLVMNLPLYEGGQISSRTREAGYRHEEARNVLKQEQRTVHRLTRDAFHGVITGASRVQALRQTVKSQELSVAAIKAGLEVGSRTTLDLVIAEREWHRVQRDYAKARYDYLLNTLRLKRSASILAEEDKAKVSSFLTNPPASTVQN